MTEVHHAGPACLRGTKPALIVTHHLMPFFGATPVSDLDYAAVERFIVAKRAAGGSRRWSDRPLGVGRLRNALKVLRLILARAVTVYKVLPANPAAGRWRLGGHAEESADPFTTAELRGILAHAEDVGGERFATMLRVWAQTGMRLGEVRALHYVDDHQKTQNSERTRKSGVIVAALCCGGAGELTDSSLDPRVKAIALFAYPPLFMLCMFESFTLVMPYFRSARFDDVLIGFVNAITGAPFGYRYVRKAEWHDDDLMGGFCEKSWQ